MAHEVETMAYNAVEKPWHGLGNAVNGQMSVDEMLTVAGLDWSNDSEPLYICRNGSYECLDDLNGDNSQYRAIIRNTDGYVHEIMTDAYNIVQNRQVMEFFRDYVEAGGMSLETAGALKHGSLVWVLAKIDKQFTLPGNDLSQTYMLLANSHDGTQEFNGQYTSVRVVCANTIRLAQGSKRGRSFSISHMAKLTPELIKQAKSHMVNAMIMTETYAEQAALMAATSVDTLDTFRYIAALFQPELLKVEDTAPKLLTDGSSQINYRDFNKGAKSALLSIQNGPGSQLYAAKDTVWGLLQGVTHYVDHVAGRGRDTALTSAWFGPGGNLKDKAFSLAVEFVNR